MQGLLWRFEWSSFRGDSRSCEPSADCLRCATRPVALAEAELRSQLMASRACATRTASYAALASARSSIMAQNLTHSWLFCSSADTRIRPPAVPFSVINAGESDPQLPVGERWLRAVQARISCAAFAPTHAASSELLVASVLCTLAHVVALRCWCV